MRLLDRITEPESPFVGRFVFVVMVIMYAMGFLVDYSAFFGAIGMWVIGQQIWDDHSKYKSKQRLEVWRREMAEMERVIRQRWHQARLIKQIEELITPEWML